MVELAEMFIHRSPVVTLAFKHLMKMTIHDFNERVLFAIVLTSSTCNCRRLHLVFASNETETRDMLESTRFNLFGLFGLGQMQ